MLGLEFVLPLLLTAPAPNPPKAPVGADPAIPSFEPVVPFSAGKAAHPALGLGLVEPRGLEPSAPASGAPSSYARASYVPAYVPQVTIPAYPKAPEYVPTRSVFNAGILLGGRGLDSTAFDPLDEQFVFGFDVTATDFGAGPLGLELGTSFSVERQNFVDLTLSEFYFGGRLTFAHLDQEDWLVVPYVSGGGTVLDADIRDGFLRSSDTNFGYYLSAGFDFYVTPDFMVGVQYRKVAGVDTDLEFAGLGASDTELDYDQVALRFGFSF